MINIIKDDLTSRIEIVYRANDRLFNLSRLGLKLKHQWVHWSSLKMKWQNFCNTFWITPASNTKCLQQCILQNCAKINVNQDKNILSPTETVPTEPNIQLGETALENVYHFLHLGSYLFWTSCGDAKPSQMCRIGFWSPSKKSFPRSWYENSNNKINKTE